MVTPKWLLENYDAFDNLGMDPATLPKRLRDWDPADCGDTLFLFLVRELSDCAEDVEECLRRVEQAVRDLQRVAIALEEVTEGYTRETEA